MRRTGHASSRALHGKHLECAPQVTLGRCLPRPLPVRAYARVYLLQRLRLVLPRHLHWYAYRGVPPARRVEREPGVVERIQQPCFARHGRDVLRRGPTHGVVHCSNAGQVCGARGVRQQRGEDIRILRAVSDSPWSSQKRTRTSIAWPAPEPWKGIIPWACVKDSRYVSAKEDG
jgi:hypothetical protein